MPSDSVPVPDRVSNSIQQLSVVAADLNKVSDELGRAICAIDTVLQGLNVGIATWVKISGGEDQYYGDAYWYRELGYARVGKKWGIGLRTREGYNSSPEDELSEEWLFNDAPRWLRIEGVAKIPELLEALIKNTEDTTKKIRTKTTEAKELAKVIEQASKPKIGGPPLPPGMRNRASGK